MQYKIDFRAGGEGQEFAILGWSHPEPQYTWTLGQRSLVRFPAGVAASDYGLKIRIGPMVRPGVVSFQRLHVAVNGTSVARLVCRMPSNHEIHIPTSVITDRPAVEIEFEMPDAQAPCEPGSGADRRELGIWISSLEFAPLGATNAAESAAGAESLDRRMLMEVQSLGENCELGFVQRLGGVEPLGLFRWASTPLTQLVAVLEARFDGFGSPECLAIEVDEASEFQVIDRRFGFRNHSFAFENTGARREDILKREAVRLPYLARLLQYELRSGEKLVCFQDAGRSTIDRIDKLRDMLGEYGPNWLLWICPAGTYAQVGTAEVVGSRLIKGYIDKFQTLNNVHNPSLEPWMRALRSAHALWVSTRNDAAAE